jgi:AcrR family transcriptional regulator
MASKDTRRRILDAALTCFLADGFEQTTIARIQERSRTSNGALFHHFPSKEAIADALFLEAMASFQAGLWELVRRRPRSLRAAVRGTIQHQLQWIEQHPDLAKFLYARGHLEWSSPGATEVAALNRDLASAFRDWMAPLVESGEIRISSMLVISAIVTGPGHSIAQRWLAGQLKSTPTAFADELAEAAWAGLRGTPVSARSRRRAPVPLGRITLELLASDGSVVARGQATTELAPADEAGPDGSA